MVALLCFFAIISVSSFGFFPIYFSSFSPCSCCCWCCCCCRWWCSFSYASVLVFVQFLRFLFVVVRVYFHMHLLILFFLALFVFLLLLSVLSVSHTHLPLFSCSFSYSLSHTQCFFPLLSASPTAILSPSLLLPHPFSFLTILHGNRLTNLCYVLTYISSQNPSSLPPSLYSTPTTSTFKSIEWTAAWPTLPLPPSLPPSIPLLPRSPASQWTEVSLTRPPSL